MPHFAAREAIPYATPLHLFGAGHPLTMALAVALGCDTFDSASYIIFARGGRYMTNGGIMTLDTMKYLPCSCRTCAKTTVGELLELPFAERTQRLATHNLNILLQELKASKEAISEGRLWDLVEERCMAHPRLREAFAELAKVSKNLALGTPALKNKGLFVRSDLDLARPELVIASKKLKGALKRSSRNAIIFSSADAPEGTKSKGSSADSYVVHPVLGTYPSELKFQYPFGQTEVAFTEKGVSVEESRKRLKGLGYRKIVFRGERTKSRRSHRGAYPSARGASARSR